MFVNNGFGFPNSGFLTFQTTNSTVHTSNTSVGSGANIALVLGGRAGRVQYETLVALRSMASTANVDILPNA